MWVTTEIVCYILVNSKYIFHKKSNSARLTFFLYMKAEIVLENIICSYFMFFKRKSSVALFMK